MKRTLAVAALLAALLPLPAAAIGNIADIVIHDRAQNRTLPVYVHEGRHYVVGQPGNEYEIRLRNRQRGDIMAVVAVDGVNAVTGETADWQQAGYVLAPYQGYEVRGWRKNLDHVAAFYFTSLPDSYAARTGRPDHVGVIGVALYRRKPEPQVQYAPPPLGRAAAEATASAPAAERSRNEAAVADTLQPAQKAARLGTGHGRQEASPVTTTEFERASTLPVEVITLYYDSYRNLVAQGIIRPPSLARPDPFPGRFVPDPR